MFSEEEDEWLSKSSGANDRISNPSYPVSSSTLAMRSSLTMFKAFLVANNSLFSDIKFSTSFPIPAQENL